MPKLTVISVTMLNRIACSRTRLRVARSHNPCTKINVAVALAIAARHTPAMRGAASPEAMRHTSAVTIVNVATPSAPIIARDRRVVNRHGWLARTIGGSGDPEGGRAGLDPGRPHPTHTDRAHSPIHEGRVQHGDAEHLP